MKVIISILFGLTFLGHSIVLANPINVIGNVTLQKVAYSPGASLKVRSPQQAAQIVKQRYGGKVLKVQRKQVNGNSGYRVKLLKSDGQVVSINIDAKTGRITGKK